MDKTGTTGRGSLWLVLVAVVAWPSKGGALVGCFNISATGTGGNATNAGVLRAPSSGPVSAQAVPAVAEPAPPSRGDEAPAPSDAMPASISLATRPVAVDSSDPSAAIAVSAGAGEACAVTAGGAVECWASNGPAAAVKVVTSSAATVSIGSDGNGAGRFYCSLSTKGAVSCWGDNGYGELGNDSTIANNTPGLVVGLAAGVVAISSGASGFRSTCAVNAHGGVQCWGRNNGVLGNGTLASQSSVPVHVTGFRNAVRGVSVGNGFACALEAGGGVECWGQNSAGQLGNDTIDTSLVPVQVKGLTGGATAISAGSTSACAITAGGGVVCWGLNNVGQLGNQSTTSSLHPVPVAGLTKGAQAVSVGQDAACAITAGGGLACWGLNSVGQLGNNTTTNSLIPRPVLTLTSGVSAVSMGCGLACAVIAGGGVECWGGPTAVPVHVAGFPG